MRQEGRSIRSAALSQRSAANNNNCWIELVSLFYFYYHKHEYVKEEDEAER